MALGENRRDDQPAFLPGNVTNTSDPLADHSRSPLCSPLYPIGNSRISRVVVSGMLAPIKKEERFETQEMNDLFASIFRRKISLSICY